MALGTDDQHFGGSYNAHKHWKKLREKHRKRKDKVARGVNPKSEPEIYQPPSDRLEGQLRSISKELYDLNYALAFGKITQKEYDKLREEFE